MSGNCIYLYYFIKFLIVRSPFERLLSAYRDKTDRLSFTFFNKKVMESLKERDLADEYIYFDVESFHQFIEFILARTPRPLDDAGDVALEANQMLRNEMRIFDVCRPCSIQVCEYFFDIWFFWYMKNPEALSFKHHIFGIDKFCRWNKIRVVDKQQVQNIDAFCPHIYNVLRCKYLHKAWN